ncbi:unnamed protein product [Danaus chrysippus]|uniref:(African queen) hypothetical protein n=1 Tax=Danaus chrysippus TaxID=151541 RepID=A0A8J2R0H2_9NEOP|nr:unnamed protein product [Danaus chrysippus]CAG9575279.1 unnamed protein product [Danaus chrysippus]CAG9576289.1 unnamed protein product [Danaus chrysippus]CAG9576890.1 unnamed protein product [Danaus chrysippus]
MDSAIRHQKLGITQIRTLEVGVQFSNPNTTNGGNFFIYNIVTCLNWRAPKDDATKSTATEDCQMLPMWTTGAHSAYVFN